MECSQTYKYFGYVLIILHYLADYIWFVILYDEWPFFSSILMKGNIHILSIPEITFRKIVKYFYVEMKIFREIGFYDAGWILHISEFFMKNMIFSNIVKI